MKYSLIIFTPQHCPIPAVHSLPTTPFPTTMLFSFAFEQGDFSGNLYDHLSGSPFIYKASVLFLSLSPTHSSCSYAFHEVVLYTS